MNIRKRIFEYIFAYIRTVECMKIAFLIFSYAKLSTELEARLKHNINIECIQIRFKELVKHRVVVYRQMLRIS